MSRVRYLHICTVNHWAYMLEEEEMTCSSSPATQVTYLYYLPSSKRLSLCFEGLGPAGLCLRAWAVVHTKQTMPTSIPYLTLGSSGYMGHKKDRMQLWRLSFLSPYMFLNANTLRLHCPHVWTKSFTEKIHTFKEDQLRA